MYENKCIEFCNAQWSEKFCIPASHLLNAWFWGVRATEIRFLRCSSEKQEAKQARAWCKWNALKSLQKLHAYRIFGVVEEEAVVLCFLNAVDSGKLAYNCLFPKTLLFDFYQLSIVYRENELWSSTRCEVGFEPRCKVRNFREMHLLLQLPFGSINHID